MTDLSDPAIREAGARACYVHEKAWLPPLVRFQRGKFWDETSDLQFKAGYFAYYDALAAELGPVIHQHAIREQMRGGGYDAGSEG